jgi:hypothetical protein
MPIKTPEPPPEAVEAVRTTLERRSEGRGGITEMARPTRRRRREPATAIAAPHQVFNVGLIELADGLDLLTAAKPTGWRFLVEDQAEPIGTAEVHERTLKDAPLRDPLGTTTAQLTTGPLGQALADAIHAAESLPEVQELSFELRLLRAPALYLMSVWLHGSRDLFVPLAPAPAPLEANRSYGSPDFAAKLQLMAREALIAQQSAERPDELGG